MMRSFLALLLSVSLLFTIIVNPEAINQIRLVLEGFVIIGVLYLVIRHYWSKQSNNHSKKKRYIWDGKHFVDYENVVEETK
ncbi:hypothetical protein D1872_98410 [compost metagenome]